MPQTPEDVLRNVIADQALMIAELQAKVRALESHPPNLAVSDTGAYVWLTPYGGFTGPSDSTVRRP